MTAVREETAAPARRWPTVAEPARAPSPFGSRDVATMLGLMVVGAAVSIAASHFAGPVVGAPRTSDLWFEADAPRVYVAITDPGSVSHQRAQVHPVFDLSAYLPIAAMMRFAGFEAYKAVRVLLAGYAALYAAAMFALLRLSRLRTLDAILGVALALSTAGVVFFAGIPDSHVLGAVSVICPLIVVALHARGRVRDAAVVAASAFSLSITVTHWMSGLAATAAVRRPLHAARLTIAALLVVIAGWGIQKAVMPSSGFFLWPRREQQYVVAPSVARLGEVTRVLFAYGAAAPRVDLQPPLDPQRETVRLTIQQSPLRSLTAAAGVGLAAWIVLLVLGAVQIARREMPRRVAACAAVIFAGQFALYFIYGNETFLYTPITTALLMVIAGAALTGPSPRVGRAAAVVAVAALSFANWTQLKETTAQARQRLTANGIRIGGASAGATAGEPR